MACYKPLKAFRTSSGVSFSELRRDDHLGDVELPCGQCIGCRMRRASEWEMRVMHEASLWPRSCFVTLTYGRDCLPPNSSLEHADFQKFMKRVRRWFETPIRFFMCGEYGPLNLRPHYHACLFNVDFRGDWEPAGKSASGAVFYDSTTLSMLWGHGRVSVQPLTPETASYCARYIMKKALGENAKTAYMGVSPEGEVVQKRPEYAAMSLKPGIGAGWFHRFGRDVFPHDLVVREGREQRPPRYYDKLYKRTGSAAFDSVEFERYKRSRASVADSSPERLQVREAVHLARVANLCRNLDHDAS